MNFDFLKPFPDMKKLYGYCSDTEEFAVSKPDIATASARKAMEYIVKMIHGAVVKTDDEIQPPTVFEMITDYRFQNYVNDETLIGTMHFIRKMGNVAAHDGGITAAEAEKVLEELHFLTGEFAILLGLIKDYPPFVKPSVRPAAPVIQPAVPVADTKAEPAKVTVEPEVVAKFAPRLRETKFNVSAQRDESENKKLFLHASLREAGWPIVLQQNQAMPASVGLNMLLEDGDTVDYILYGRDNKPLAVIEYTATARSIVEGRTKGIEKANKLSAKYGYKPVVYYTNGYLIYIIDQLGYKPRRIFQFHSIEELELFRLRATMRQDISNPVIEDNITNRKYQKEAITAACRAFMQKRRHSLLVMATGTGKTRISISLADILLKSGWVKNILFLADRTSLVRQAHKNFNKLLPSVTTSVYSGGSMNRDPNARIIFSTYQTMINLINDDTREFGIGRFDLIIIDEAHRSIFAKYSVLFHYFDALMLGLTATPRSDDNKSTYEMFELQNGNPDYAYELTEAIADKYLVGFQVMDRTTAALQRGIHYDDLSEKEKRKFEDTFASGDSGDSGDSGEPVDFTGTVLGRREVRGRRVINLGTINAMLGDLMKNGLKINGGDKLGKTIIFAGSHIEAEQIVLRFQKLYPNLGADFCKLIDAQTPNNLALIDSFGERDQLPQIAVSVDMLDTGIDVPDVLNLVFYKRVEAKIKFLQMIGRGTRLCPDVFGPGMDKKGFLIFDYYDNFGYFRTNNTWSTVDETQNGSNWASKAFNMTPQSILINECKLGILRYLLGHANGAYEIKYRDRLQTYFIKTVQGLCNDDIEVVHNMSYVSKYRTAERWDDLSDDGTINEIEKYILPLFPPQKDAVKVKTFDLMMLVVEEQVPERFASGKDPQKIRHGFGNVFNKISKMMVELEKLKTIPAVRKEEQLISAMQDPEYLLQGFSLERCEHIREKLRKLVEYIPDDKEYYIVDAQDYIIGSGKKGGDADAFPEFKREKTYAEKAKEYIEKGSPALAKLRNLDELTEEEKTELNTVFTQKLGTAGDYASWSQNKPLLPFLRVQTGIADEAVQTKFGSFLNTSVLTATQLTYMNQIVSYARENGDIVFLDLQRVSPFCDTDIMGLFGTNIAHIKTLINGLHRPVMN